MRTQASESAFDASDGNLFPAAPNQLTDEEMNKRGPQAKLIAIPVILFIRKARIVMVKIPGPFNSLIMIFPFLKSLKIYHLKL